VEFRILGPLEVVEDGNPVALGTLKERLVLAVLLLHANEFVSRERLIDDLWGPAPPPTARQAVNVYLSKLRKTLGVVGTDPIATASGGYRLLVDPERLDASRMQRLVACAREHVSRGELESAAERFREALALWRGPTLAGLLLESRGRDEVARLDELRLAVLMDQIDCDLALGRHEQALGELGVLVREHPLRERLRAQQMLALYRAGRQADALGAFAEARRTLVDDLGIEPSEALQRLQQAILRHDPSLETAEGTATVNGLAPHAAATPPPTRGTDAEADGGRRRRRFRPRRWQLALAAIVILSGSGVAAALLARSAGATPHVVPNSLVRIDPGSGKIVSDTRIGVEPQAIAVTPSAIWTVNNGDNPGSNAGLSLSRYDLRTHKVQTPGGIPPQPFDLVADAKGTIWVSSFASNITRLAFRTGGTSAGPLKPSQTTSIPIPWPGAGSLALGQGYLWVIAGPITTPGEDDRAWLVDLATNKVVRPLRLGHATTSIAYGDGAAWIGGFGTEHASVSTPPSSSSTGASWLTVISPAAPRPHSYRLQTGDTYVPGIAVGNGKVWVLTSCGTCALPDTHKLLEFDPNRRRVVHRFPLGLREPNSVAVGAGYVWFTNQIDASVTQLDPRSGRIIRTIPVGEPRTAATCGIAATHDAVWVTIGDNHPCVSSGP
jgi:DNA-binding SARP family transcriptional activator